LRESPALNEKARHLEKLQAKTKLRCTGFSERLAEAVDRLLHPIGRGQQDSQVVVGGRRRHPLHRRGDREHPRLRKGRLSAQKMPPMVIDQVYLSIVHSDRVSGCPTRETVILLYTGFGGIPTPGQSRFETVTTK